MLLDFCVSIKDDISKYDLSSMLFSELAFFLPCQFQSRFTKFDTTNRVGKQKPPQHGALCDSSDMGRDAFFFSISSTEDQNVPQSLFQFDLIIILGAYPHQIDDFVEWYN